MIEKCNKKFIKNGKKPNFAGSNEKKRFKAAKKLLK